MTPAEGVVLFLVGAAAGTVNSVGGGGTLLCIPALVAAGLGGRAANATSTVALLPGMAGAILPYRDRRSDLGPGLRALAAPCVLGGAAGAASVRFLAAGAYLHLLPWLVLAATTLYAASPAVRRLLSRGPEGAWRLPPAAAAITAFAVSFYGGFFGAGIGILLLALLAWTGIAEFDRANGLKLALWLLLNLAAAVLYAGDGLVAWPEAGAMAAGCVLGGYAGARSARRAGEGLLRGIVILTGLATAAAMLASR